MNDTLAVFLALTLCIWPWFALRTIPLAKRAVLVGLRIVLVLLLLAALYQPSFTFTINQKTAHAVRLFIDNSSSMASFDTTELHTALRSLIALLPRESVIAFGDSARVFDPDQPLFTDTKSILPKALVAQSPAIVLSDFALDSLPQSAQQDMWYVPLHGFAPQSQLDVRSISTNGNNAVLIQGYTAKGDKKQFALQGTSQQSAITDTGWFTDTLFFKNRVQRSGFYTDTLQVFSSQGDTIAYYFLHKKYPDSLYYSLQRPGSVDTRFFILALKKTGRWHYSSSPEHLIISSKNKVIQSDESLQLILTSPDIATPAQTVSNLEGFSYNGLFFHAISTPPLRLKGNTAVTEKTIIAMTSEDKSLVHWSSPKSLNIMAADVWRIDFDPSTVLGSSSRAFWEVIIDELESRILAAASPRLTATLSRSRFATRESLQGQLRSAATTDSAPVLIQLYARSDLTTPLVIDTLQTQRSVFSLRHDLPPGSYTTMFSQGRDTVFQEVELYKAQKEHPIRGFEHLVARNLATEVNLQQAQKIISSFLQQGPITRSVQKRISLTRTTFALAAILLVLCTEWVLRRRWHIDR